MIQNALCMFVHGVENSIAALLYFEFFLLSQRLELDTIYFLLRQHNKGNKEISIKEKRSNLLLNYELEKDLNFIIQTNNKI